MKSKLGLVLAALVVTVAAVGVLAGCEIFFAWGTNHPYARVTDAEGTGISGVTVTLTGDATFSATTDSAGKAVFTTFTSANVGDYVLSASGTGYAFFPMSVTIDSMSIYVGTLMAYVSPVSGTVVDARVTDGVLAGATVSLYAAGGTTALATATSGTDGVFAFPAVAPGSYTVSTALTDYAFIDKAFTVATVGETVDIGEVIGFASSGNNISLVAVWSDAFDDVDSHITYPDADNWNGSSNPSLTGLDPYSDTAVAAIDADVVDGFFPIAGLAGREEVDWHDATRHSTATYDTFYLDGNTTTYAVALDRDETQGSGPETITITAPTIPVAAWSFTTVGDATNGLPVSDYDYAWIGVMEYYVQAYGTPTLSTEGESGGAEVEVYVIQGSEVKGRFVLPDYMTTDTVSVLRINMFVQDSAASDLMPVYQFLPDIRLADSGIKSVAQVSGAPLVLFGEAR